MESPNPTHKWTATINRPLLYPMICMTPCLKLPTFRHLQLRDLHHLYHHHSLLNTVRKMCFITYLVLLTTKTVFPPCEFIYDAQEMYTKASNAIKCIQKRYDTLRVDFVFPAKLHFVNHDGTEVSIDVPDGISLDLLADSVQDDKQDLQLAYATTNAPLHAYSESLSQLLVALDEVETVGVEKIRDLRRGLIQQIDEEARYLDRRVAAVWQSREVCAGTLLPSLHCLNDCRYPSKIICILKSMTTTTCTSLPMPTSTSRLQNWNSYKREAMTTPLLQTNH
jgi:hypothetical protein